MQRKAAVVLILVLWAGSPVAGQEWARKMFESNSHDFGSVARYAKAEHQFVFSNLYIEDVHVAGVRASCGCTSVSILNPTLKTYQKGAILAKFNTDRFQGSRAATLTVTFDKPYRATIQLQVKGIIRLDVVLNPGSVALGSVDQGTPATKTISVTRSGRPGWKILEVRSANPHLSGRVLDTQTDGYRVRATLEVRLDENAPTGYVHDHLILVTNDTRGANVPVPVDGRVLPTVTVSPEQLFLGVVHPGERVTKQFVVRGKQPFRVTSVTSDQGGFQLNSSAGETSKAIHVIPIEFTAGDEPGRVEQTIRFETDLGDAAPEVSALAVVEP